MPRRYSRPHGPWTCQVCTYQNQPRRRNCEMCNKPVGTAAPPTVLAAPSTSTTTASRPPRTYGLHSASGQIVPLSKATVKARVRDFCVEVDIEQTYCNTSSSTISASYQFPIDSKAAVSGLQLRVGDRLLQGTVQERAKAAAAYTKAVSNGQKAALVEEDKDSADVFKCQVGNLAPAEKVVVHLQYITELTVEGESLRFFLPTAVAARYDNPATAVTAAAASSLAAAGQHSSTGTAGGGAGGGAGGAAGALAPSTVAVPATGASLAVDIAVDVQLPSEVLSIESPSHTITTHLAVNGKPNHATVALANQVTPLGNDFVLLLKQKDAHRPRVWVERCPDEKLADGKSSTATAVAAPTAATAFASSSSRTASAAAAAAIPKTAAAVMVSLFPDLSDVDVDDTQASEYIFVIDRSGSMSGSSIKNAVTTLQLCLRSIPEGSTFNIVGFGSTFDVLFPHGSQPYNDHTLATATAHVASLKANLGGTNILAPLHAVLSEPSNPALPRQVFLLTDGAVKNTRSVIEYVAARHAATGTRCFAFGIGNDVSHALVTGVAAAGGGDAEFVVPGERMEEKVVRQLSRAMQPVLTQTRVNWGALEPYMITPATPAVMNPIFTGSHAQAFAFVRPDAPVATVTVSAQGPNGTLSWPITVDVNGDKAAAVTTHVTGTTLRTAAVRSMVRDIEFKPHPSAAEQAHATQLACTHGVACRWASWVVVDPLVTVSKPAVAAGVRVPCGNSHLTQLAEQAQMPQQRRRRASGGSGRRGGRAREMPRAAPSSSTSTTSTSRRARGGLFPSPTLGGTASLVGVGSPSGRMTGRLTGPSYPYSGSSRNYGAVGYNAAPSNAYGGGASNYSYASNAHAHSGYSAHGYPGHSYGSSSNPYSASGPSQARRMIHPDPHDVLALAAGASQASAISHYIETPTAATVNDGLRASKTSTSAMRAAMDAMDVSTLADARPRMGRRAKDSSSLPSMYSGDEVEDDMDDESMQPVVLERSSVRRSVSSRSSSFKREKESEQKVRRGKKGKKKKQQQQQAEEAGSKASAATPVAAGVFGKTAAPFPSARDAMMKLLLTQSASGAFTWSVLLPSIADLGFYRRYDMSTKLSVAARSSEYTAEMWATAVALVLLDLRLGELRGEWKISAGKARRWLARALGDKTRVPAALKAARDAIDAHCASIAPTTTSTIGSRAAGGGAGSAAPLATTPTAPDAMAGAGSVVPVRG